MREGIRAPLLMLCLFDFGLYPVFKVTSKNPCRTAAPNLHVAFYSRQALKYASIPAVCRLKI